MQLNLDLRPLIFMTTAIFWLLGTVMFLMGKAQAPLKGTREWAIGNFISGLGMLLLGFYSFIPDFFSIVLSNTFILLGISYLLAGLRLFKGKPVNYLIFFGLPAFTLFQSVFFTFFIDLYAVRKILFTLAIIIGMIIAASETFVSARRPLLIAMRITAFSCTLYAIIMLIRIGSLVMYPSRIQLLSSPMHISIWVFTSVIQISNSIGFLLMFLYKQSMQLQSSLLGMKRFFFILAHDLRGPIRTTSMIAGDLSSNRKAYPEDQRELFELMKNSSLNTLNLLENLLEWGKNLLGDLHPQTIGFNLSEVLKKELELAKSQAQTKQIEIKEDISNGIMTVGDENMCHTIARNLLSNAIKFTPEGGSVKIFTEQTLIYTGFTVSDTGIGIAPEIIKELLNANPVLSLPGTNGETGCGLGLSFCQSLVEKNRGEMIITSELGKGTSIRVKLPPFHETHPKPHLLSI
jgi:two-component system sensor histidine kinase/response regulator